MESIAQIQIHQFESEMEVVYAFEPEVLSWRGMCKPGTSDVEHAFLVCLTDKLEVDATLEEQLKLRKVIQATLHWMRLNGTLV